ncbi:unnamed protein product, partial [Adineta steineri]
CGLEFCIASAFTYIPPILLRAGISELLVILGFCLTIILCLIFILQSNLIEAPTIGLSLLVISCILFDFAAQACFDPCESLIYDIYKGCLGYLITATDWTESYLKRLRYDQGVRAGSYGLLFHCIVSVLYAPFLKTLIHRFGIHLIFSFSMFIFALSMLIIYISRDIIIINIMASLSGLGMVSLTSIPYKLVIKYHTHREVVLLFFKILFVDNQTLQTYEIGTILSVLDSTYFALQMISSIMMGYIILIFKSTLSYIVTSFILAICSIYFINRIVINRYQLHELLKSDR